MTTSLVPTWTLGDRLAKARHLTGLAQKAFGPRPRQPCGTLAAYRRHQRHREPIDPACRDAANAYARSAYVRRQNGE